MPRTFKSSDVGMTMNNTLACAIDVTHAQETPTRNLYKEFTPNKTQVYLV